MRRHFGGRKRRSITCGGATHSSRSDERELENPAGYPARQHRRSLGVCHDILRLPTIRPVAVVLTGAPHRPIHARKRSSGNVFWLLRCCPFLHAERKPSETGVPVGCAASVRHWARFGCGTRQGRALSDQSWPVVDTRNTFTLVLRISLLIRL